MTKNHGSILLSPKCKINYVNIQHGRVNMPLMSIYNINICLSTYQITMLTSDLNYVACQHSYAVDINKLHVNIIVLHVNKLCYMLT